MIETRLLVYFLAVARELNITKAAESLFLSQSTLSKQMQELERELGKQLFLRGGRKLTLTDDGIYLRDRAQEIVTLMEQTENALAGENKSLNGDLTIGCGETIAMDAIGGMMADFQRQYPDVKLHTFSGDADAVRERIDKGLCDMGLLLGPMRQERYDYLNIYTKDIYGLLMRDDDPLAAQDEINIDQLKSLPIILADQTFYGHQDLDWFGRDESVLQVVATYNLIYNATFLVEHGVGYALTLAGLVNTTGRPLAFRPITPELSLDLYIVTKKYQTLSPAARAFHDQLKAYSRQRAGKNDDPAG